MLDISSHLLLFFFSFLIYDRSKIIELAGAGRPPACGGNSNLMMESTTPAAPDAVDERHSEAKTLSTVMPDVSRVTEENIEHSHAQSWAFESMLPELEAFLKGSFTSERQGETFSTRAHSQPMKLWVADKIQLSFYQNACVKSDSDNEPFYAGVRVKVFNDYYNGQDAAMMVSYGYNRNTWGVACIDRECKQRVHATLASHVFRVVRPLEIIPFEEIKRMYTKPYPFQAWVAEHQSDGLQTLVAKKPADSPVRPDVDRSSTEADTVEPPLSTPPLRKSERVKRVREVSPPDSESKQFTCARCPGKKWKTLHGLQHHKCRRRDSASGGDTNKGQSSRQVSLSNTQDQSILASRTSVSFAPLAAQEFFATQQPLLKTINDAIDHLAVQLLIGRATMTPVNLLVQAMEIGNMLL